MHRVRYCIFIRFFFRFVSIFELFVVVILLCCFGLQHNNDSVCIFYDRFGSRIVYMFRCLLSTETLYNVNEAKLLFVIHEMDNIFWLGLFLVPPVIPSYQQFWSHRLFFCVRSAHVKGNLMNFNTVPSNNNVHQWESASHQNVRDENKFNLYRCRMNLNSLTDCHEF